MTLRSNEPEVAQDNVQRPGADCLIHHGDEPALVLEVYDMLEPGVEAIGARPNVIPNAQQHDESVVSFQRHKSLSRRDIR